MGQAFLTVCNEQFDGDNWIMNNKLEDLNSIAALCVRIAGDVVTVDAYLFLNSNPCSICWHILFNAIVCGDAVANRPKLISLHNRCRLSFQVNHGGLCQPSPAPR